MAWAQARPWLDPDVECVDGLIGDGAISTPSTATLQTKSTSTHPSLFKVEKLWRDKRIWISVQHLENRDVKVLA